MNAATRPPPKSAARWVPAIAAAALLGTVVVAGAAGGSGGSSGTGGTTTAVAATDAVDASDTSDTVEPVETTEPPPVETRPETEKVPLERTLANGVVGDDVRRVQERLHELGFNPGPVDGVYGSLTIQSIWAYEKLVLQVPRDQVTGRVTPEMWDDMQDHVKIQPRRPEPGTRNHLEVYLPEQVVAMFHDGEPVFVAHSSHGTGEEWCREVTISPGEYGNEDGEEPKKEGRCGVSNTPGGIFTVHRKHEGRRDSALGGMLNPVYFNYGIAIHGAYNVPNQPASHGCVRVANAISEDLFGLMSHGDRVFVWDGEQQPEHYGEQLPTFDWAWDEWYETSTTSTTTTTTTTPPTTEPEPTTTTTVATTTTEPAPETAEPESTTTTTSTTVADRDDTSGSGDDTSGS
ncbi:MAG: L,D-transpeptidase family protein [Ilumatobacteraceae bacterium]